ncbi:MAG: hypothetical protein AB7G36_10045 [Candidatus Nanopelagicales bacterium]
MTAFMCLGCADSGEDCPVCQPATSPEVTGLLLSLVLIVVGVAITVLSCRANWRWWL